MPFRCDAFEEALSLIDAEARDSEIHLVRQVVDLRGLDRGLALRGYGEGPFCSGVVALLLCERVEQGLGSVGS